jgi:hypothetical protein
MTTAQASDDRDVIESRDMGGLAGYAVGVMYVAAPFAFAPGNIQNASTLPFPVAYECAEGVGIPELLGGEPRVLQALLRAEARLEKRGVRVIVGACGSFANFQRELTAAASVPVFSSILTQTPWLLSCLPPSQRLAIVFADQRSFTERVRQQCGIDDTSRVAITDGLVLPAFRALLERPYRLAHRDLEAQLSEHLRSLTREHPGIGLIMLQCSELVPYAAAIQQATGRAVVDVVTLATWAHEVAIRRPYRGFV